MSADYVALHDELDNHPRISRGWVVYSISRTNDLRWVEKSGSHQLQQLCSVTWRHLREQHIGGGYYSNEDKTSEWLIVPLIQPEESERK